MLTIAVVGQKGGSGKTTISINVAAAAHLAGLRTLVLDLDQQASAFDWAAERSEDSELASLAIMQACGSKSRKADDGSGGGKPLDAQRFAAIARGYDVVVLDGPPRLGHVTQSAAFLADVAVLPILPGPFDFWAADGTIEALDAADALRALRRRPPVRRAFVMNRAADGTILSRDGEAKLREQASDFAGDFAGVVHQRTAFPTAALRGESVLTMPNAESAAEDIRRLWRYLERKGRGR